MLEFDSSSSCDSYNASYSWGKCDVSSSPSSEDGGGGGIVSELVVSDVAVSFSSSTLDGADEFPLDVCLSCTNFILLRLIIPLGGFEAFLLPGSAFTLYKISESFLLIIYGPD